MPKESALRAESLPSQASKPISPLRVCKNRVRSLLRTARQLPMDQGVALMMRVVTVVGGLPVQDLSRLALDPLNKHAKTPQEFELIADRLAELKREFAGR